MALTIESVNNNLWKISSNLGDVYTHNLSGDHNSFSFDSTRLAVLENTDQYHLVSIPSLAHSNISVTRAMNGAVNEDFMWGPSGKNYVFLDGSNLVYRTDSDFSVTLPGTIDSKSIQWRASSASGYGTQLVKGLAQSPDETYIKPFQIVGDEISLLPGYFIDDIADDGNVEVRNIVRYQTGFMASLVIGADYERFWELNGSGYKILEPADGIGNAAMSHPTTNLTDMISGRSSYGDIDFWTFNPASNSISYETIITNNQLETITGRSDFPTWYHGTMNDQYCLFNTLASGELDGIYFMDNGAENVRLISKCFDDTVSGTFNRIPRPTLSQNPDMEGNYWGAWHEEPGVVYLAKIVMNPPSRKVVSGWRLGSKIYIVGERDG